METTFSVTATPVKALTVTASTVQVTLKVTTLKKTAVKIAIVKVSPLFAKVGPLIFTMEQHILDINAGKQLF